MRGRSASVTANSGAQIETSHVIPEGVGPVKGAGSVDRRVSVFLRRDLGERR
jgi:hypothetical protein